MFDFLLTTQYIVAMVFSWCLTFYKFTDFEITGVQAMFLFILSFIPFLNWTQPVWYLYRDTFRKKS